MLPLTHGMPGFEAGLKHDRLKATFKKMGRRRETHGTCTDHRHRLAHSSTPSRRQRLPLRPSVHGAAPQTKLPTSAVSQSTPAAPSVFPQLWHDGAQQEALAALGLTARMKALMNLPSTSLAIASTSIPLP